MVIESLKVAGADVAQHLRCAAGTDEWLLLGHLIWILMEISFEKDENVLENGRKCYLCGREMSRRDGKANILAD